jgi:glutamate decarboxylase
MSMDLLDRLIADICAVTEALMDSDQIDLAAWQPFSKSVEKEHSGKAKGKKSADSKHPMKKGIHKGVC